MELFRKVRDAVARLFPGTSSRLKASTKPFVPLGEDRTAWNQAWGSMPHRRLLTQPKVDVFGRKVDVPSRSGPGVDELVEITISENPPEYSDRVWRQSEICPVCGEATVETARLPA